MADSVRVVDALSMPLPAMGTAGDASPLGLTPPSVTPGARRKQRGVQFDWFFKRWSLTENGHR